MKKETPQQIVLRIEAARNKKRLKKGDICRHAGKLNSWYSAFLDRGYLGKPLNPEHLALIEKAIEELPDKSPVVKRKKSA